ncbi:hypothetical protein MTR67_022122 [Solanum verrucosum]|uniref:F-box domain-containing protein n=1 Tax=Solanum verrucosum TaxID=315347 RepID=A0AAF0QRA2_SOLVR|nr:hypothetical protein MTR67_022122 [Solanum verrucosum]
MSLCEVASDVTKSTTIGDLPNDILHRILENMPIKDVVITSILSKQWLHIWSTLPHLVFDHLFFDHVGASAASIIRKILMQHTENIRGFHLISKSHTLLQSDVDQFIMFVSNHGVQKFTLDMDTDGKYVLPDSIFTCSTLTHLKLSRCIFNLPVEAQFPNLVSLQLKLFSIDHPVGSNNATLILPMLETLELMCCFNAHSVNLNIGSVPATNRLDVSLNLQSLKICELKISVKCFSCLLCLLQNCPKLVELDIYLLEKVDATRNHSSELFYYLKTHDQVISEALRTIRTVRLRKFKGTAIEMYLYVSNIGASAATVIYKILMQHTGNIMGFHLISSTCKLAQSDVDQFIIFVCKHGIQKLTLDIANEENYMLPNRIFTCATWTHLKLSRCFFRLPDGTQFPNLISLQLEHSKIAGHQGSEDMLNLPMLETLELGFCVGVDSVYLVCPKLDNMSLISSYTITFQCFNVNPIFAIIKHLCLNGTSLEKLGSVRVPDKLRRPLKLQSLKICDFKISVESISCAFRLLRNSPNLYELEIDEVVKADETSRDSAKLLSYLSMEEDLVNEALKLIQTVRLRKFKGSNGTVKIQGSKEGRKGQLAIDAETFEITPAFHVVEVTKRDTAEYSLDMATTSGKSRNQNLRGKNMKTKRVVQ